MNSIEGWEFKTKLILDEMGNRFPLVLYMEKPSSARRSPESSVRRNPNQLMLLACKKVPKQVRLALHPGAFKPRKAHAGWVLDPGRRARMWQEAENGRIYWVVDNYLFYQVTPQVEQQQH